MDKQTKRNLSNGAVISADLKSHSITTTLSACGKSGTEDNSEQDMSKVFVEGPANNQDSLDKHTESDE